MSPGPAVLDFGFTATLGDEDRIRRSLEIILAPGFP